MRTSHRSFILFGERRDVITTLSRCGPMIAQVHDQGEKVARSLKRFTGRTMMTAFSLLCVRTICTILGLPSFIPATANLLTPPEIGALHSGSCLISEANVSTRHQTGHAVQPYLRVLIITTRRSLDGVVASWMHCRVISEPGRNRARPINVAICRLRLTR